MAQIRVVGKTGQEIWNELVEALRELAAVPELPDADREYLHERAAGDLIAVVLEQIRLRISEQSPRERRTLLGVLRFDVGEPCPLPGFMCRLVNHGVRDE